MAKHKATKSKSSKKLSLKIILPVVIILLVAFMLYTKIVLADTAAVVNGEKISTKRVDAIYNSLPNDQKLDKSKILDQIITTKLLVGYIERNGYALSEEEFNILLGKQLKTRNTTLAELEADLSLRGATLDDVRDNFLIERFVKNSIAPNIQIKSSEVSQYKKDENLTQTDKEVAKILFNIHQRDIINQIVINERKTSDVKIYVTYK